MSGALRSVGEERFDACHEELARRMAALATVPDVEAQAALETVSALAEVHFGEEDAAHVAEMDLRLTQAADAA